MTAYYKNPFIQSEPLPVEIVLHPSWWHAHAGISFDKDFFYHPAKRVESKRRMEAVLHERFGRHGLGADRDRDPVPAHQAEQRDHDGPGRDGLRRPSCHEEQRTVHVVSLRAAGPGLHGQAGQC
ncbi:MAG: hypothetical protein ACLQNE_15615 [Thermoguttaceae bacterium]|jgi:hypothetical protein